METWSTSALCAHRWGAYGPKVATNTASGVYVNSTFDSGNMDIVDIELDGTVKLAIHHDPYCETDGREHFQWCAHTSDLDTSAGTTGQLFFLSSRVLEPKKASTA